MHTTELKLKTVTPMFLHGHNNMIVELRPPPFKALFRYWWRTVQDRDVNSLREHEAELFGSTDGKAPFSIRIPGKEDLGVPIKCSPLPHKGSAKMDAYDVGKTFNLRLITKNEQDALEYQQIAKLGFLLGGVGNRSRRGFGSICEASWNFKNVSDLRKEILETLNALASDRFEEKQRCIHSRSVQIIESKDCTNNSPEPKYPVIRRVFFAQQTDTVKNLLEKIGEATHKHQDRALGYARGGKMASPIHVRIQKVGTGYLPIVVQLYSVYPDYTLSNQQKQNFQKQLKFIDHIIKRNSP